MLNCTGANTGTGPTCRGVSPGSLFLSVCHFLLHTHTGATVVVHGGGGVCVWGGGAYIHIFSMEVLLTKKVFFGQVLGTQDCKRGHTAGVKGEISLGDFTQHGIVFITNGIMWIQVISTAISMKTLPRPVLQE